MGRIAAALKEQAAELLIEAAYRQQIEVLAAINLTMKVTGMIELTCTLPCQSSWHILCERFRDNQDKGVKVVIEPKSQSSSK